MSMWSIRGAVAQDRAEVERLWDTAGLGACNDEEWRALTVATSTHLLVAEDGGRTIGTAVASFDGWRAFIYHVAVAPDRRGEGVATSLMAEAEATLRRQGARRACRPSTRGNTEELLSALRGRSNPKATWRS
jgi:ribosomal protein S18 acetylase RimI-like enzyme